MPAQQFKALVVDDEPIARRTVGFALGQEGFNCAYACDGDDALKRLAGEKFDLVVTDLRMPNKHGYALAVQLLARENAPVIVVHSSVDDPRLTKDLMVRGVDDIVYKPANYAAIAAKMRVLVQRRKTTATATTGMTMLAELHCPVPLISWGDYERRLANVQHLFPLSSAAHDVFRLSNCEDTTIGKLVSSMLQDAALTADVLRLANSAFYDRNNRPTIDIGEAIARIGFNRVGEVALALNALGAFRGCVVPWLDEELCQARSLAASLALERLCEVCDYSGANDGMTLCAFLHPLARLVLGSAFQNEYQSLIQACLERNVSLSDLEHRAFPETHTAALSRVLSQWNIPGDIWGPLSHVGGSYEFIERLETPVRNRVELIKLAIFIGEVAVGHWMPWDQIEPPPEQVLVRHQIPHLAPLIEQTKQDIGPVAESFKMLNGQTGHDRGMQVKGESMHRVLYSDLSGGKADWMPSFLASLGIETIAHDIGKGELPGGMLVNCLNADPRDLAAAMGRDDRKKPLPLFLIERDAPREIENYGATTRFPTSVAALRASCQQLAKSIEPPNTRYAPAVPASAQSITLNILA